MIFVGDAHDFTHAPNWGTNADGQGTIRGEAMYCTGDFHSTWLGRRYLDATEAQLAGELVRHLEEYGIGLYCAARLRAMGMRRMGARP